MVTSDDERRDVAARLRFFARDFNGTRDFRMYLSCLVGINDVTDDEGKHFSVAADRRRSEITLEKLADLIDRPTCNDVGDRWTFRCSVCGCELDVEDREGEPTMWFGGSAMTPRYCPNCGAVVTEKEEDDGQ